MLEFARQMGATSEDLTGGGDFVPTLKINYEDETEDGKEIKKGTFYIQGGEVPIYAKDVTSFRPVLQHFQWTKWDDIAKKVANRTRFISTFKEEARDEEGTVRCGKPPSKELKANPALAKKYEDVTCYRTLHGFATLTGVTPDGETHTVENAVVSMRLKGSNFAQFEEEFIRSMPKGSNIWDFPIELTASKEKNGASTYWVIHFNPDFTKKNPNLTRDQMGVIIGLRDRIEQQNKDVDQKYYDALAAKSKDDADIKLVNSIGSKSLDDDMNDDIPF
jgi:hypothetical protein